VSNILDTITAVLDETIFSKHAKKTNRDNEGRAPNILNLRTSWTGLVNFMPWLLYPLGKSPRHPLNRKLGEWGRACLNVLDKN
jgi:hypothetical protein